jgi:hypothetical protein
MTTTIERIDRAYARIYDLGDTGLDYLDRHAATDVALMQHLYNDTLDTLTPAELKQLADSLETIASDAEFDIEQY